MNEGDMHAWRPLMLAICILLVAIGYAAGALHGRAIRWALGPGDRVPPATPRAIAGAARRNRADLRDVRPAREHGVRVTSVRLIPTVRRPEPTAPADADLDKEHTQP